MLSNKQAPEIYSKVVIQNAPKKISKEYNFN